MTTNNQPKVGDHIQVNGEQQVVASISLGLNSKPTYLYFRNQENELVWVRWDGKQVY